MEKIVFAGSFDPLTNGLSIRRNGIPLLWLWGKTEVYGIKIL